MYDETNMYSNKVQYIIKQNYNKNCYIVNKMSTNVYHISIEAKQVGIKSYC